MNVNEIIDKEFYAITTNRISNTVEISKFKVTEARISKSDTILLDSDENEYNISDCVPANKMQEVIHIINEFFNPPKNAEDYEQ